MSPRAMRRPRTTDLVAGVLTAGFGSAVLVHIRTFPQLPGGQPGPALFPGIIGALLVVFGVSLVVQSVAGRGGLPPRAPKAGRKAAQQAPAESGGGSAGAAAGGATADTHEASGTPGVAREESPPATGAASSRREGLLNAAAVLATIVAYILLADHLGFAPTMVLLMALLMWRLGTRPLVALGAAVATTAFITVIFRLVLLVPLPQGPLGL